MSDTILRADSPDGVVTLTFNRPQVLNALNWEAQNAFADAIENIMQDSATRALIITGAGERAFCAGGDLQELAAYASQADGARLAAIMGDALDTLTTASFPVIAAINGYALGGGAEIVTACDICIMHPQTKIGFPQARLGLTPGWGAGHRLRQRVGYNQAMRLLLDAQPITAQEALAIGLIQQIADDPLQAAQRLARRIATWDSNVVTGVKKILAFDGTSDNAQQFERELFPQLWASDAHLQAVENFLRKKHD